MNSNEAMVYPKFRFYVALTLILGACTSAIVMIAPAPLIGEVAKYLGRDLGLVTFAVMSLWTVALVFGGLISGVIADRLGIAKMFILAGLLTFLSAVLTPAAGVSLAAIVVLRLAGGIGAGILAALVPLLVSTWFPPYERPYLAGINWVSMASGVMIGVGSSPVVFVSNQSFPQTMVLIGLPVGVFIILAVIMLFGEKKYKLIAEAKVDPQEDARDFKLALKEPIIYLLVIYVFMFNWILQGINDLTPGYFAVPKPVGVGFGPVVAGQIMMIFQLALIVGALLNGVFYHLVYKGNAKLQIMMCFLFSGLYFFLKFSGVLGEGPNPLLFAVLIITAFFHAQGVPAIEAFIARYYPKHITGRVGGVVIGIGLSGGAIGVAVGAAALSQTHSYQMSISIVTIVAIIGFLAAMAMSIKKTSLLAGNPAGNKEAESVTAK